MPATPEAAAHLQTFLAFDVGQRRTGVASAVAARMLDTR